MESIPGNDSFFLQDPCGDRQMRQAVREFQQAINSLTHRSELPLVARADLQPEGELPYGFVYSPAKLKLSTRLTHLISKLTTQYHLLARKVFWCVRLVQFCSLIERTSGSAVTELFRSRTVVKQHLVLTITLL